jgi:hypothetical protein
MNKFRDPLSEHQAVMASLADPLKNIRESIRSMTNPLEGHKALMASIADPLKEHRALIASITDPLKEHRTLIASMANPLKEHSALIASIADPLKEHRALMASMADPLKSFRASIAAISDPFKELSASILNSTSLSLLKDVALEVGPDLFIEADGLISLSSKRITATDLQEFSDLVIHNSSQIPSTSLEESLNNLVEEIRSQKDPLTQKILMWFIYPLIVAIFVSFINPVIDYHVESYLNADKRTLSKQLKKSVKSSITDENILGEFRYVSADILNVRYSASKKSESIGYLRFGYTVIVIERQKSWTLIEWNDRDTDAQVTGWVFSRYLAKFK